MIEDISLGHAQLKLIVWYKKKIVFDLTEILLDLDSVLQDVLNELRFNRAWSLSPGIRGQEEVYHTEFIVKPCPAKVYYYDIHHQFTFTAEILCCYSRDRAIKTDDEHRAQYIQVCLPA